ncbi:hypothetical protein Tco_0681107 [Tanacetum coccineum]|uniref:Retrotransposon gag domain-containing protein n=1 Tax=Tanacetum coccineum TaxID=301880 RepID=A0ABQ4XNQ4_9ASTR
MARIFYPIPCIILSTGRTANLRKWILMFQQHHGESLSEAWTHFKDLHQKFPHHGIDRWLQIEIFYDHVSFHLKCEIDSAACDKLCNKNTDKSWEFIENLALYNHEDPSPQPQALDTTFKARVQDYMAAHTERMERLRNAYFKNAQEIQWWTKVTPDNAEKLTKTETETPVMEVDKINEVENEAGKKSIKTSESEKVEEAPGS